MAELYKHGELLPTAAPGCEVGAVCPVEILAYGFLSFVTTTGTYVKLCNVSREDTYFAKGIAVDTRSHAAECSEFARLPRADSAAWPEDGPAAHDLWGVVHV